MSRIPSKKPAVFLEMQHLFGPVVSIFQRIFHTFQSVMQNSWNQRSSWIMMLKSSKTQKKSANTQRFGLTNNIYTSVTRDHPICRQIWIHQGDSPPKRHWEFPMGGGPFWTRRSAQFLQKRHRKKRRNSGFARQGPKIINIVISRRNVDHTCIVMQRHQWTVRRSRGSPASHWDTENPPRPELVLDSTLICPKKTVVVDVGCVEKPWKTILKPDLKGLLGHL